MGRADGARPVADIWEGGGAFVGAFVARVCVCVGALTCGLFFDCQEDDVDGQKAREAEEEVHAREAQRAPDGGLGAVAAGQQVARGRAQDDAGREEQPEERAVVEQPRAREGRRPGVRGGFAGVTKVRMGRMGLGGLGAS